MGLGSDPDAWRREVLYAFSDVLDALQERHPEGYGSAEVIDQAVTSFLGRHGLDGPATIADLEASSTRAFESSLDAGRFGDGTRVPLLSLFALSYTACAREAGVIDDATMETVLSGIDDLEQQFSECRTPATPVSCAPETHEDWAAEIDARWQSLTEARSLHAGDGSEWEVPEDDLVGLAVVHASLARELTFNADVYPFFRTELEKACTGIGKDWELVNTWSPKLAFAIAYILFHQVLGILEDDDAASLRAFLVKRLLGTERERGAAADDDEDTAEVLCVDLVLRDSAPRVWRRVHLSSATSLLVLHRIIQACMGWHDRHCFEFHHRHRRYTEMASFDPEDEFDGRELGSADKATVGEFLCRDGDTLAYNYDFGDDWWIDVVRVEDLGDGDPGALPRCVDGANAAPPEDCGGLHAYCRALGVLADPADPEHDSVRGSYPEGFDPQSCDLDRIAQRLTRLR